MNAPARLAGHWARRFVSSLSRLPPATVDEQWLLDLLTDAERDLYRQMTLADRRHAVGCARAAVALLGEAASQEVVVASALHDVGKIPAGLGTFARSVASLAGLVGPLRPRLPGRVRAYLDHSEVGVALLTAAGSEALVVEWARQHHWPPSQWTIDPQLGHALVQADG